MEEDCAVDVHTIKVEVGLSAENHDTISRKLKQGQTTFESNTDSSPLEFIVQESTKTDCNDVCYRSVNEQFNDNCAPIKPLITTELRLRKIQSLRQTNPLAADLLEIEILLADRLMTLDYGEKVSHVYNPIDYAFMPHFEYYRRYCYSTAQVIMVGMNPGPFGMAQSGVSSFSTLL